MTHTGVLHLKGEKRHSRTILSGFYEGAFKFTRPVYLDEETLSVYMIHIGGGYVDGDSYVNEVTLEEGAELSVTSQAASKVYKTISKPVEQVTRIRLAAGSTLDYCMDPLIMYEGARFNQTTIVDIDETSSFFYNDIVTPGWSHNGEPFRYDWYRNKLKVTSGSTLVLYDHLLLDPGLGVEGVLELEGHSHVGSVVLFHKEAGVDFVEKLSEHLEQQFPYVRFGLSSMDKGGVVIRMLGDNTQQLETVTAAVHTFYRETLLKKKGIIWRKY